MANILNSAASFSSQRKEGNGQVPTHLKMATCFIECGFGQLIFFSTLYFSNQRLDGGTPIHLACRLGTPEILQCLYEHDPVAFQHALVDKEVMTPLHRFVTIRKAACFLICLHPLAKSILGGEDVLRKKANLCSSKEVRERENPAFIAFQQLMYCISKVMESCKLLFQLHVSLLHECDQPFLFCLKNSPLYVFIVRKVTLADRQFTPLVV